MTEEINDQISAFVDDELSEQECAFLVRRFDHDPTVRGKALRYTMIGSALRSELLQPDPAVLRRRIAGAIDGAPLPVVRVAGGRWTTRLAKPLLGVGIAASVALGAIVGLRFVNDARIGTGSGLDPAQATAQSSAPAPSYVVPLEVSNTTVVTPPHRLTNYLVRHSEYASGLSRTSVRSNVVGAAEEAARESSVLEEPRVDAQAPR
jgi:sigma-E factor negative regulatory protein RseA